MRVLAPKILSKWLEKGRVDREIWVKRKADNWRALSEEGAKVPSWMPLIEDARAAAHDNLLARIRDLRISETYVETNAHVHVPDNPSDLSLNALVRLHKFLDDEVEPPVGRLIRPSARFVKGGEIGPGFMGGSKLEQPARFRLSPARFRDRRRCVVGYERGLGRRRGLGMVETPETAGASQHLQYNRRRKCRLSQLQNERASRGRHRVTEEVLSRFHGGMDRVEEERRAGLPDAQRQLWNIYHNPLLGWLSEFPSDVVEEWAGRNRGNRKALAFLRGKGAASEPGLAAALADARAVAREHLLSEIGKSGKTREPVCEEAGLSPDLLKPDADLTRQHTSNS